MPVIELCEAFNHFHYMRSLHAPSAMCGKRGRVARILSDETWMGAPGPFPATWCGRCSARQDQTRECQITYYRHRAIACVAGRPDLVEYRHNLEELFSTRIQAGTGYLDIIAELERTRQRKLGEMHSCTDWVPEEYERGFSIIYA